MAVATSVGARLRTRKPAWVLGSLWVCLREKLPERIPPARHESQVPHVPFNHGERPVTAVTHTSRLAPPRVRLGPQNAFL